jgi:RNA polymerase sigma factor (sigma-70 family)
MTKKTELAHYEGLIFTTAARYSAYLDDELEDIQQLLRVKVWKSLGKFDPKRSKMDVENWVFSCVRNYVKDLLKSQYRRNKVRNGHQGYIEDESQASTFEVRYFSETADEVYFCVEDEDIKLPSTLSEDERSVTCLLMLNLNQSEIARVLHVSRDQVRRHHESVKAKMADWRPAGSAPAAARPRVAA